MKAVHILNPNLRLSFDEVMRRVVQIKPKTKKPKRPKKK
jgi:hypothetical protein